MNLELRAIESTTIVISMRQDRAMVTSLLGMFVISQNIFIENQSIISPQSNYGTDTVKCGELDAALPFRLPLQNPNPIRYSVSLVQYLTLES